MSDPAFDVLHGLRIELPSGKVLTTTRPLLFPQAVRWLELSERWNRGAAYEESVGVIIREMPEAVGIVDMSVLDDLTFGEVMDATLVRFLVHRRPPEAWSAKNLSLAPTPPPP